MELRRITLGLLFLLCFVRTAKSFSCYECQAGGSGGSCNDPPVLTDDSVTEQRNCLTCEKVKVLGVVTRQCLETYKSEGCSTTNYGITSSETCYCNTNLCNTANSIVINFATTLFAALMTSVLIIMR